MRLPLHNIYEKGQARALMLQFLLRRRKETSRKTFPIRGRGRTIPVQGTALQTVKLVHSLQWQSSGQGCSLHDSSDRGGTRIVPNLLPVLQMWAYTERVLPSAALHRACSSEGLVARWESAQF